MQEKVACDVGREIRSWDAEIGGYVDRDARAIGPLRVAIDRLILAGNHRIESSSRNSAIALIRWLMAMVYLSILERLQRNTSVER